MSVIGIVCKKVRCFNMKQQAKNVTDQVNHRKRKPRKVLTLLGSNVF